jgi:hypothetical protein
MRMYDVVLLLHSWLRWIAVGAGLAATALAYTTPPQAGGSTRADRWGLIFMISLDLQFLLGLLLYFWLSPSSAAILRDFGAAMRDPVARFWAVEHIALMVVAVVMVHLGRVLSRRAPTPAAKQTRTVICFTLATVAMLAAIPWPGLRAGRPLFRV